MRELVAASGSALMELTGIGPSSAAPGRACYRQRLADGKTSAA